MPAFAPPGLFGKIPSRGDFVRVRAADELARSFVLWLEEGSDAARRGGAAAGAEPIRFLFRRPGADRALVGAVVASADKAGRRFPLAVFAPVGGGDLGEVFPAVPLAAGPFLTSAAALLADASRLAPSELAARLDDLPRPGPAEVEAAAVAARDVASRESGSALLGRALGGASPEQQAYALQSVAAACGPERGREGGGRRIVLACPARSDAERWFWLELVRRALGWPGPPPFFWRDAAEPCLFVCPGAAPPSAFADLWRAAPGHPNVWPLKVPQAVAASAALRPAGQAALAAVGRPELSVSALLGLVAP